MIKQFRCDCGWAFHSLRLDKDFDEFVISVVNASKDYSFRQRLKMAWAVLKGDEHHLSEIILHRDELDEFKDFVKEL